MNNVKNSDGTVLLRGAVDVVNRFCLTDVEQSLIKSKQCVAKDIHDCGARMNTTINFAYGLDGTSTWGSCGVGGRKWKGRIPCVKIKSFSMYST